MEEGGVRGPAIALLLLVALAHGGDRIDKRDHGKRTGKQFLPPR